MPDEGLHITQRDLPHWDLAGSVIFLTWRVKDGQPDLTPAERTLVREALLHFHGSRYHLFAWVVMNDHVHVLFRPLGEWQRSQLQHSWKSYTANRMQREHGRRGSVWQEEGRDRLVRNEREFLETWQYIVFNPEKRWPGITGYQWVSPIES